jgi:arylsulfatase A-like enzyme
MGRMRRRPGFHCRSDILAASGRGIKIDTPISNVDYAPTLLSLCGVKVQGGVQGVNLASMLTRGRGPSPESIYAEGGIGQSHEWRMVVRGGQKLVVDSSLRPTHLYNLNGDPYEQENLVARSAQRRNCQELTRLLRGWAARTADRIG